MWQSFFPPWIFQLGSTVASQSFPEPELSVWSPGERQRQPDFHTGKNKASDEAGTAQTVKREEEGRGGSPMVADAILCSSKSSWGDPTHPLSGLCWIFYNPLTKPPDLFELHEVNFQHVWSSFSPIRIPKTAKKKKKEPVQHRYPCGITGFFSMRTKNYLWFPRRQGKNCPSHHV